MSRMTPREWFRRRSWRYLPLILAAFLGGLFVIRDGLTVWEYSAIAACWCLHGALTWPKDNP